MSAKIKVNDYVEVANYNFVGKVIDIHAANQSTDEPIQYITVTHITTNETKQYWNFNVNPITEAEAMLWKLRQ